MKTQILFIALLSMLWSTDVRAQRFTRALATVADMIASNPNSADTNVICLGYYVQGDGGGGPYVWVKNSAVTANTGTSFASTYPGAVGRWLDPERFNGRFNIRRFGGKGNGSSSQAAFDSAYLTIDKQQGGEIFFPVGNWVLNATIVHKNISLTFQSNIREDAGLPTIVSNIVKAANVALPIITVGNGTDPSKGFRLTGGTFIGNGSTGVGLRLAGGAYECYFDRTAWYNFQTNRWIQGTGTQPCAIHFFNGISSQAANVDDSRELFVAAPDAGTGFTTSVYHDNFHFNSQAGAANARISEFDGVVVNFANGRFDIVTNCMIRFSQTAGISVVDPVMEMSGVAIDGSSTFAVLEDNYGASQRGTAFIQGSYTINGRAHLFSGLDILEEGLISATHPGGTLSGPNLRGTVSFMQGVGMTTNRTWMTIQADDNFENIFNIFNTNGTMAILGRTNISLSTGSGTFPMFWVQPGFVSITNGAILAVYGAGAGPYSDAAQGTARIFTQSVTNALATGLFLDSYQNTFAHPLAIKMGFMNSTNGEYTSQILHFGQIDKDRATAFNFQTHTATPGLWNPGIWIGTNGFVGINMTNPTVTLEVTGDGKISAIGNSQGVRTDSTGKFGAMAFGAGLTWNGVTLNVATNSSGSASNAYVVVMNDGSAVTTRTNMNFVGTGLVATDNPGANRTDISSAFSGTVTSVGATVPGGFAISGSPVTSSGTLAITSFGQQPYYFLRGNFDGSSAWDNTLTYSNANNTTSAAFGSAKRGRLGDATGSPASGGILGQYRVGGWNTASYVLGAGLEGYATENWTATANGTQLRFYVVTNTAAVQSLAMTLGQDRSVNFPVLTASQLVGTDASKNLVSISTGYGLTNASGILLSNNIAAGAGITITPGASGQLTIASVSASLTNGYDGTYRSKVLADGLDTDLITFSIPSNLTGGSAYVEGHVAVTSATGICIKTFSEAIAMGRTDSNGGVRVESELAVAGGSQSPGDVYCTGGFGDIQITDSGGTFIGATSATVQINSLAMGAVPTSSTAYFKVRVQGPINVSFP